MPTPIDSLLYNHANGAYVDPLGGAPLFQVAVRREFQQEACSS